MMKTITTLSLLLALSCFFNSAFAANPKPTPKTTGQIQVSCPIGSCWVVAGAAIGWSDSRHVGAGNTMSVDVRACDKLIMHPAGTMTLDDLEEFIVAPCSDNFLPTRRRVHFGDTIRVTGTLGLVKYEIVHGDKG